jgi:hypothetical protein
LAIIEWKDDDRVHQLKVRAKGYFMIDFAFNGDSVVSLTRVASVRSREANPTIKYRRSVITNGKDGAT